MKPPMISVGFFGWMRSNLFSSPLNTFLSLVALSLLFVALPPLVRWSLLDSIWVGTAEDCRQAEGACWAFIGANYRFILFGFFPYDQQWRPFVVILIIVTLFLISRNPNHWKPRLLFVWLIGLGVVGILMPGGMLGLEEVEIDRWGGLPLTLLLSLFGVMFAYPFGIILALGKRSDMPAVRSICVGYIELIRGVPLISLLFMSSVMLPLFLPEGVTINKLLRAQIAIILFAAAYLAEVVRGGLQSIPKGQYEAADSLGLGYFEKMRLVILPQALKIMIPPTVSIFISTFKDTSLVVIISLFDLLGTTKAILADPNWLGFSTEGYVFAALIYFVFCFSIATYSKRLEVILNQGRQR